MVRVERNPPFNPARILNATSGDRVPACESCSLAAFSDLGEALHGLAEVCQAENVTLNEARDFFRAQIEGRFGELKSLFAEDGTVADCAAVCWDTKGDIKQYSSSALFAMYLRWGARRPVPANGDLEELKDISGFGKAMKALFESRRVLDGTVYLLSITAKGREYADDVPKAEAAPMEP